MLSIEKQILYLISSTDGIDIKLLIEIYQERGISSQIIRNTISQLKKRAYIDLIKRSCYEITPLGRDMVQSTNGKLLLLEKCWDKRWFMVIFEIPETERKKRDRFRSDLIRLGFGLLYKSIYISPWNHMDEVTHLSDHYDLHPYIKIVHGEFLFNEVTTDKAEQLWGLNSLNETYKEKQLWFRSEFQPGLADLLKSEPHQDLLMFIHFLTLGEVVADLLLKDPMLPNELLPSEWSGRLCLHEFHQCLHLIASSIPADSKYFAFVQQYLKK